VVKTKMKKGKREDRWQKAIIGIAMVLFILVTVMAAMVPIGGAESWGDNFNHIVKDTVPQKVLIGQNLQFEGFDAPPIVYRLVSGDIENTYPVNSDNRIYNVNWPTSGAYYVNYNTSTDYDAQLSVEDVAMPLEIKVDTKKVSSIAAGTNLTIDTGGMNLYDNDQVDLVVIGPDGQIKYDWMNKQNFTGITVEHLTNEYGDHVNKKYLKTVNWSIGAYTFQVKTKTENACGLEAKSAVNDLKIMKGAITIEAETASTVELEMVKFTVTGASGDKIKVEGDSKNVIFKRGLEDTPTAINTMEIPWFNDTIDADGIRNYAVEFNDVGSYAITVTVTEGDREGDSDTVDITVSEKGVDFDLLSTVVIGDKIAIQGTATSGTYVSVYIDDTLYNELHNITIEEGEFSEEAKTTDIGMDVPGSVRLKAWIDCMKQPGEPRPTRSPDGEAAVLLTIPTLEAELSVPSVALGDDFKVKGVSRGADTVNVLAVGPKGSGGTAIDTGKISTNYAANLFGKTVSVSTLDRTFETKIYVDEDADTGLYLIAVLSPGRDGIYDGLPGVITPDIFAAAFVVTYNLVSFAKTQDQIVSMARDATIDAAGSDDLAWGEYIMVQPPSLLLNTVSDAPLGEPLVVTGTTNREEGYIVLVEAKGPVTLAPQTVPVTNGTFCATFDTAAAEEGNYTVTADDGDGHIDEATVEILETAPTPTSKVTPTPPPVVSPKATATPKSRPKTPGFDVVFAIAGLLAAAYFLLIMKK
jgi:hypothetical protein